VTAEPKKTQQKKNVTAETDDTAGKTITRNPEYWLTLTEPWSFNPSIKPYVALHAMKNQSALSQIHPYASIKPPHPPCARVTESNKTYLGARAASVATLGGRRTRGVWGRGRGRSWTPGGGA
jgi:hypothetical protein